MYIARRWVSLELANTIFTLWAVAVAVSFVVVWWVSRRSPPKSPTNDTVTWRRRGKRQAAKAVAIGDTDVVTISSSSKWLCQPVSADTCWCRRSRTRSSHPTSGAGQIGRACARRTID